MSKRNKFLKNGLVNPTDVNHTGTEPTWEDAGELTDSQFNDRLLRGFNFYTYYLDFDDFKNILMEYMVSHSFSPDDIKKVRKCGKEVSIATDAKIARMIMMGMPSNINGKDFKKVVDTKITSMVRYMSQEHTEPTEDDEPKKPKAPVIPPMKRLEDKVNAEVICHLDWALDEWIAGFDEVKPINLTQLLGGANIPAKGCKFVHDFLDKYLIDLRDAHSGECEQCVEAYSFLTRRELNKWIKTFEKMKEQVEKYEIANKKAIVRVKKTKPAIKQVEKLNYLTDSDDLKSIPPVRICGAMILYTYNVKTRKLSKYQSLTRDGLSVKGTSIKDFDESKSYTFTIREKVYDDVKAALNKKDKAKALDNIKESTKTKVTTPNGRCNEHTLLLWSK